MRAPFRSQRGGLGVLIILSVELAQPAGAVAQAVTPAALAGGCYDLSLGPWRPRAFTGGDSIFIAPPSRVRFDTTRTARWPDAFLLAVAPDALPSVHRYAMWRPAAGDKVELLWSTGFSGLRMTLGGGPDELRGEAATFWDFPRDPLTADAVARRVACDAPAQVSSTAQRFVFRAVPLEGGDSVALGMTLAAVRERADSLRGRRTLRTRGAPAGPFAGATAVEFSVNPGDTVWRVEVTYPEDSELEPIAASLSRVLGAPLSRDTMRLRSGEFAGVRVWWGNRTTNLALRRDRLTSGGWRTSVLLTDPRMR